MPPRLASLTIGLGILSMSPATLAEPRPSTSLSWVRRAGAEQCTPTRALAQSVERRIGHPILVSASQAELSIEGQIDRVGDPPVWHAVIVLSDATGKVLGVRELTNTLTNCAAFDEELTLVLALMIDPDAALGPASSSPPPTAPSPPSAESKPVPERAWAWELDAGGAAAQSLLPGLGLGAMARVGARSPWEWGLEAFGTFWGSAKVQDSDGRGSSFRLLAGGATVCPVWRDVGVAQVKGCGGLEVGSLVSRYPLHDDRLVIRDPQPHPAGHDPSRDMGAADYRMAP